MFSVLSVLVLPKMLLKNFISVPGFYLNLSLSFEQLECVNFETVMYVVLYGCETWSLTLREEHRVRVFENKVLM